MHPSWSMWAMIPEVHRIVSEAAWPQIPQAKLRPSVQFGAFMNVPAGESIIVTGATARADSEPHTLGNVAAREDLETPIVVTTNVPGRDALSAFKRAGELGAVLQGLFRDMDTGKPIITDVMKDAGVWQTWIRTAETLVVPLNTAGATHWVAGSTYILGWTART